MQFPVIIAYFKMNTYHNKYTYSLNMNSYHRLYTNDIHTNMHHAILLEYERTSLPVHVKIRHAIHYYVHTYTKFCDFSYVLFTISS